MEVAKYFERPRERKVAIELKTIRTRWNTRVHDRESNRETDLGDDIILYYAMPKITADLPVLPPRPEKGISSFGMICRTTAIPRRKVSRRNIAKATGAARGSSLSTS